MNNERLEHIRASYEASKKGHASLFHPGYDESIAIVDELLERRQAEKEPVAEVVSKHGDPEFFGERELKILTDIQSMPYGTLFYSGPVTQQNEQSNSVLISLDLLAELHDHALLNLHEYEARFNGYWQKAGSSWEIERNGLKKTVDECAALFPVTEQPEGVSDDK